MDSRKAATILLIICALSFLVSGSYVLALGYQAHQVSVNVWNGVIAQNHGNVPTTGISFLHPTQASPWGSLGIIGFFLDWGLALIGLYLVILGLLISLLSIMICKTSDIRKIKRLSSIALVLSILGIPAGGGFGIGFAFGIAGGILGIRAKIT